MSLEVKLMEKLSLEVFNKFVEEEQIFIPLSEEKFTNLAKVIVYETLYHESQKNSSFYKLLGFLRLNKLRERAYQNEKLRTNIEHTGIFLWGIITALLFVLSIYLLFY